MVFHRNNTKQMDGLFSCCDSRAHQVPIAAVMMETMLLYRIRHLQLK